MIRKSLTWMLCLAGLNFFLVAAAWAADEPFRDPRFRSSSGSRTCSAA